MKLERGELRNAILADAAQRIRVSVPLVLGLLAGFWSLAVKASAISLITTVAGFCLATIFFAYILLFEGERIKEKLLAKYEEEVEAQKNTEIWTAIMNVPDKDKQFVRAAYEDFSEALGAARAALKDASASRQLLYEGPVNDIERDAIGMLKVIHKVSDEDRERIAHFLGEAVRTMQNITGQCAIHGEALERGEENLELLRSQIDAAHRAMESVNKITEGDVELL